MGKHIKIYNKATGTWEIVSSGSASGISTSNPDFLQDDGQSVTSVDDALGQLSSRVKKLERNVSWLAIYGGSGSGGSGGGGGSASITITNVVDSQGTKIYYTSGQSATLNYLINATRNNQRYYISVILDGTTVIYNQAGWSGVPGVLTIPNVAAYSSAGTHNVTVTATDVEGINTTPFIMSIIEASIRLESSKAGVSATVGMPFNITYTINNRIVGKDTNLIVKNVTNGITKTINLGVFETTDPVICNVNFFDLFNETPSTGSSYTIEAYAQTTMDDSNIVSDTVVDRIIIEDGSSLVVLIDGITTKEEVDSGISPTVYSQDGNISFSFTTYLSGVSIIYYSVMLTNGVENYTIGTYYPDTEHSFSDNQYVLKGNRQVFSWSIPSGETHLGSWDVYLKCWSEKGAPESETHCKCVVSEASQVLLDNPNPQGSRYAFWDIKSSEFPQTPLATQWRSVEEAYIEPGASSPTRKVTNLNVYNTNGTLSGFLTSGGQNRLRLAGEAYGVIDLKPFGTTANWGTYGFGISITFKTDKHPFSDRTVFMCGDYSAVDGSFLEGMKVGLEEVIWKYKDGTIDHTISCRLQQGIVNTVDFVLDPTNTAIKIFVNGVLNAAQEIVNGFNFSTESKLYLACDLDPNGKVQNFSDVEFYDIKLYRRPVNDKFVVINALNSRAKSNLLEDGTIDYSEYNNWKTRNFFSVTESSSNSSLWDDTNSTYKSVDYESLISDTNRKAPLPVLFINCAGSGFTRAVYEALGRNETLYSGCQFSYYDPDKNKSASTTDVSVQIQGTSSTGYRSKNLEIAFHKICNDGSGQTELFQPKDTWMPESGFTLKADVVDSAHANNASIGKWINDNADLLFDKTPPMLQLESHRPTDLNYTGQSETGSQNWQEDPTVVHKDVTIKHTLEGFPIILLIQFDGESTQTLLGIYSFNLGRNSFYNMGFKFLKSYTTRQVSSDGQVTENSLPAFITSYKAYAQTELFGDIDQRQIYSYEFSENANTIEGDGTSQPTALFWQDDLTILKHVGEFRYNGALWDAVNVTDDNIWRSLQTLFTPLAQMTVSDIPKYIWNTAQSTYSKVEGEVYPGTTNWSTMADELSDRLCLRNAYSYFLICTVFGLVDSLGKNMTLRSWNVGSVTGSMWYPCFYDMDTANGLSNIGNEDVAKTAYIDTFKNAEVETGVNSMQITPNDANGGYDEFSSRLWNVLRDVIFKNTGVYQGPDLNTLWANWRNTESLTKNSDYFIDTYFASQTKECGELLYNYDYNIKYLTKYVGESGGAASYANITFLHGTRVEFVRDWLKKRFMFFDGVFYYSNSSYIVPYNEKGAFSCGGAETSNPKLTVKTNTPLIFTVNIGQSAAGDIRYFIPENTPTDITLMPVSSFNTQITVNGISEISKLTGLKKMRFQNFMGTMRLPSFDEVDLADVTTLSSNPVDFATVFVGSGAKYSEVRHVDLSGTKFWESAGVNAEFVVNLEKYDKLKTINISNSCVTSLSLPNASLTTLKLDNSAIRNIDLNNQPFLTEVSFAGCNMLQSVTINNCSEITSLELDSLRDLKTITITSCPKLKTIKCTNNINLTSFIVQGSCTAVETINISGCTNPNLGTVYLVGAQNVKSLNLSGTTTGAVIQMASGVKTLTSLNLSNSSFTSIQWGNKPIQYYNEPDDYENSWPILDLSEVTIGSLVLRNMGSLRYVKFDNNPDTPVVLGSSFFSGCGSLYRIFGHIRLAGVSTFSGCTNFHIHNLPEAIPTPIPSTSWFGPSTKTDLGKSQWASGGDYLDTNISIGTTSMAYQYRETGCNLYDVYYTLLFCSEVTSLDGCFYGCKNIVTSIENSLNPGMFAQCGKVTSMSAFMYAVGSLNGVFYSPSHTGDTITSYNGLLSPLKSLTSASSAFHAGGVKYIDDLFFSPIDSSGTKLGLTSLSAMFDDGGSTIRFIKNTGTYALSEGKTSIDSGDFTYARSGMLLKNLPDLTSIYGMFCGSSIKFETETYAGISYCPLFWNQTKLTTIQNSFRSLTASGELTNIFGGNAVFDSVTTHFPQKLTAIYNSFTFSSGTTYWYIHNRMFHKIAGSLKYITGTSAANLSVSGTSGCFAGSGLIKRFRPEGTEVFPYEVFKECTQIIEIPAFFERMTFATQTNNVPLPITGMFDNNTRLTNVSYLFASMSGITYTLGSKAFRKCSLINASYIFNEPDGYNSTSKIGGIPYGLFYQEKDAYKNLSGWTVEDAKAAGITEKYGINPDGTWNESAEMPRAKNYTVSMKVINPTIQNLTYALGNFHSQEATGYTLDRGTLTYGDCGDLVEDNPNYNPVKYILNPNYDPREIIDNPAYNPSIPGSEEKIPNPNRDIRRVILNTAYDKYRERWNRWAVDGNPGLAGVIGSVDSPNSEIMRSIASGAVTTLPGELPAEFSNPDDEHPSYSTTPAAKKRTQNYFCPADIFRYCSDGAGTRVDYMFANSGLESSNAYNYQIYGLCGRIPPMLFEPLSKINNLIGVFWRCRMISPYMWPTDASDYVSGQMYPAELFAKNTALQDITGCFAYHEVPEQINISPVLFANNMNLRNIDRLWMGTLWAEPYISSGRYQVPVGLFSKNSALQNIRGVFASYSVSVNSDGTCTMDTTNYKGRSPKNFPGGMINSDVHRNITNVSFFLGAASSTHGSVPAFWEWLTRLSDTYRNSPFHSMSKRLISNSSAITSPWDNNMVD